MRRAPLAQVAGEARAPAAGHRGARGGLAVQVGLRPPGRAVDLGAPVVAEVVVAALAGPDGALAQDGPDPVRALVVRAVAIARQDRA